MSQSFESDNSIDEDEAKRIRTEWEQLKAVAERFVVAVSAAFTGSNFAKVLTGG